MSRLIKATGADLRGSAFDNLLSLYLDEPNDVWVSSVANFDYVIFSTGQWFYGPLTFYENGQIVGGQQGCHNLQNTLSMESVMKVGVATGQDHLQKKKHKAITMGSSWKQCIMLKWMNLEKQKRKLEKKGLHFGLIDISEATSLRPDAYPDKYGLIYNKNVKVVDCVHWCLPGAIDTWNEFLFYKMKQAINKTSTSI
ncbi:protein trichome birefringence-like 19 [Arachis ipaensis]|nr:protein trichome birefringence-like 19 [Arachis ipaensis]